MFVMSTLLLTFCCNLTAGEQQSLTCILLCGLRIATTGAANRVVTDSQIKKSAVHSQTANVFVSCLFSVC